MKTHSDTGKLRELLTSRLKLQEMLKKVFPAEGKLKEWKIKFFRNE